MKIGLKIEQNLRKKERDEKYLKNCNNNEKKEVVEQGEEHAKFDLIIIFVILFYRRLFV